MPIITIRGRVRQVKHEDGKQAAIAELGGFDTDIVSSTDGVDAEHVFVRIQSWDEKKRHPALEAMRGRDLVVTIQWAGGGVGKLPKVRAARK